LPQWTLAATALPAKGNLLMYISQKYANICISKPSKQRLKDVKDEGRKCI